MAMPEWIIFILTDDGIVYQRSDIGLGSCSDG